MRMTLRIPLMAHLVLHLLLLIIQIFFIKISGLNIKKKNIKTKFAWICSKMFSNEVFHHSRWKLDWGSTTLSVLVIHFFCRIRENYGYELQQCVIKNKIINSTLESKNTHSYWSHYCFFESLILSKLNHLFISLPTPKK